ncbi:rCG41766 [Rattus norvegicus]|uniref:RCG41766 n=1 Tax=Rattus norvegicus TaxID=10116 RepID=A6KT50_RAT|nr:rCG41766 [Rattus norvegicus]
METVPKTLARLLWMIRRWRIPFGILRTTELI